MASSKGRELSGEQERPSAVIARSPAPKQSKPVELGGHITSNSRFSTVDTERGKIILDRLKVDQVGDDLRNVNKWNGWCGYSFCN